VIGNRQCRLSVWSGEHSGESSEHGLVDIAELDPVNLAA